MKISNQVFGLILGVSVGVAVLGGVISMTIMLGTPATAVWVSTIESEPWGGVGRVTEIVKRQDDNLTGAEATLFPLVRVEMKKGVIVVTALDPTGQSKVGDQVRVEEQKLFNKGTYESSFYFIRSPAPSTMPAAEAGH